MYLTVFQYEKMRTGRQWLWKCLCSTPHLLYTAIHLSSWFEHQKMHSSCFCSHPWTEDRNSPNFVHTHTRSTMASYQFSVNLPTLAVMSLDLHNLRLRLLICKTARPIFAPPSLRVFDRMLRPGHHTVTDLKPLQRFQNNKQQCA